MNRSKQINGVSESVQQIPDAIILCGGAGTRLRSVTGDNSPKSMATVAGRPFLELLFRQLQKNGFKRVILAVGFQKEVIRAAFGDHAFGLELVYSEETSPLGTGGALRKAADLVATDFALTMNGDSFAQVDLRSFVNGHRERASEISMVVVPTDERNDAGSVRVGGNGQIEQFAEKQPQIHAQYVNAGIYLMSRRMLFDIPAGVQVSLEKEIFPRWLDEDHMINAFVGASPCVDIGTPDRYRRAQGLLADLGAEPAVRRQSQA